MHSNTQSSIRLGLIVGLLWSVVQFGISEVIYQTALWTGYGGDLLYDMSDTAAWPAGIIYDQIDRELMQQELSSIQKTTGEETNFEALKERLNDPADEDAYEAALEIFDANGREPYVPLITEYSIYGGICLCWGAMIGISVGFAHSLRKGL